MSRGKIGVLGGTFDPVHLGHLIIADEVRQKLALDEVLFVPAGQPWLKGQAIISAAEHRLEMLLEATASNPCFNVSTIELERPGPSYSIDTIMELQAALGAGAKLFFIVGFDALADLRLWKDPGRLIRACQVVGVARPGHSKLDLRSLEADIPGAAELIMKVEVPQIGISASDIRTRVARGTSIRYMVPEGVGRYILEHGLYSQGGLRR